MTGQDAQDARLESLRANLARVRERIAQAALAAGRPADSVTLVAVTKNWPAADIGRLSQLGVRDVGENRDQEAAAKYDQCRDLPLTWHFIGQLQRNKAASVARYADVVQSIDRSPLVAALQRAALRVGRVLGVCLQVDLEDGTGAGRGGVPGAGLMDLAVQVADQPNLRLLGLMAVAPLGVAPQPAFARLAELSGQLVERFPGATVISAGMSSDLGPAIAAGATHVRIGTALMGTRAAQVT